jgi:Tol biopolymer transport system component
MQAKILIYVISLVFAQLAACMSVDEPRGGAGEQQPIAVLKPRIGIGQFTGDIRNATILAGVIRADLNRSGTLHVLSDSQVPFGAFQRPDWNKWRGIGADFVAGGGVEILSDGKLRVTYRVWNVQQMADIGGQLINSDERDLRPVAHVLADLTHELVTGVKGTFAERRLSVVRRVDRYILEVTDSDGFNGQVALSSPKPIILPTWLPKRERILYVSLETDVPLLWVQDVKTAQRFSAGSANEVGVQCAAQMPFFMATAESIPTSLFDEDWRKLETEPCVVELLKIAAHAAGDLSRTAK